MNVFPVRDSVQKVKKYFATGGNHNEPSAKSTDFADGSDFLHYSLLLLSAKQDIPPYNPLECQELYGGISCLANCNILFCFYLIKSNPIRTLDMYFPKSPNDDIALLPLFKEMICRTSSSFFESKTRLMP